MSIGIPNGLLGSAWPVMYQELQVSIGNAGIFSLIISSGTIVAGITHARLVRRWGTVKVLALSQLVLGLALLAFALIGNFYWLCLICFPIGYSSGIIDTGLSAFLTLHYKAIHLNWLHAFWAVGASIGPLFITFSLLRWNTWQGGYYITAAILVLVFFAMILTVPRWQAADRLPVHNSEEGHVLVPLNKVWQIKGAKETLFVLFGFCGIEAMVGLWGSSYLVKVHGLPEETAATWISLYFAGIMLGRIICGFLSLKWQNKSLIRMGEVLIVAGILLLFLPLPESSLLISFFLIGLGLAPMVPMILFSTPEHFGGNVSQSMIGVQMASMFVGSAVVPPIFGWIAGDTHHIIFPYFLAILLVLIVFAVISLFRKVGQR